MADLMVIWIIYLIFTPFFWGGVSFIEQMWWHYKEKMGWGTDCDCRTPRDWSPLGSTFVCDECARKWYSTHDNVAWCGWAFAPWWKRIQMNLGWERKGRRKFEDPPEVLTPEPESGMLRAKEILQDILNRRRVKRADRIGTGGS